MAEDFIDCVADDKTLSLAIGDAVRASEVAIAFTRSFKEGRIVSL